jgi:hypothetical protein
LPRKPNYKFERMERDRAKAKKKAERQRAKADRKESLNPDGQAPDQAGDNLADGPAVEAEAPAPES